MMNLHAEAGGEGDSERRAEGGLILAQDRCAQFAASLCPLVAALKTYTIWHLFASGEPDPLWAARQDEGALPAVSHFNLTSAPGGKCFHS